MATPTAPTPIEDLPASGEVYQVDTEYVCDDTGASAVIGAETVPLGSVIIAPPGSQAVLAGAPAYASAADAADAAADALIAGHAARLTSSSFIAPDPTTGSPFTFASPGASAWAATGQYLWFPSYGFCEVLSSSGDVVNAKNISIPKDTRVAVGIGFHTGTPSDVPVDDAIGDILADASVLDANLPVSDYVLVDSGGSVTKGRTPRYPATGLVGYRLAAPFELKADAPVDISTITDINESWTLPAMSIPDDATHVTVRGVVSLTAGTTIPDLVCSFNAVNGLTDYLLARFAAPASETFYGTLGEVDIPVPSGGNAISVKTTFTGTVGAGTDPALTIFLHAVGYKVPGSAAVV